MHLPGILARIAQDQAAYLCGAWKVKYNYPKPTPTQRVKHGLYWLFLAVTFIPFVILFVLGQIAERMEAFLGVVRRWCFSERYVRRLPRRGKESPKR